MKKYGLHPGTKVKLVVKEDGLRIIPLPTPEEIHPVRLKSHKSNS
jgi:hypothetical protein